MERPLILISLAIVAAGGMCLPSLAANEAQVYAKAQQDFAARKFTTALEGFQNVARTLPRDPSCHYYLALCYQNLGKVGPANLEYQWLLSNSTNPKLKAQAQQGLNFLAHYKPPAQSASVTSNLATQARVPQTGDFARGKIKIIEFSTKWCRVCKIFDPVFDQVQRSNKYGASCEFKRLDGEEAQNQQLLAKYGVTGFPTTIFADSKGKQITRFSGGTNADGLMSYIDSALQKIPR